MRNDTRIGVDIAKAVFEMAVSDRPGRVHRIRQGWMAERTARLNAPTT